MQDRPFQIRVECYAGYRGEETPCLLYLGECEVAVIEVLDRWLTPDHRYFKLRGDDGASYIIRHDPNRDEWVLTLFDSGRNDAIRLSST